MDNRYAPFEDAITSAMRLGRGTTVINVSLEAHKSYNRWVRSLPWQQREPYYRNGASFYGDRPVIYLTEMDEHNQEWPYVDGGERRDAAMDRFNRELRCPTSPSPSTSAATRPSPPTPAAPRSRAPT